MLGVLLPLATASWLALGTAELGRLAPWICWGAALLVLLSLVSGLVWAIRAGRLKWEWRSPIWFPIVGAFLAMAQFGQAATPWPAFLDASWYVNTGARIATDGTLEFQPPAWPKTAESRRLLTATFADQHASGITNVPADDGQGFVDVVFALRSVGTGSDGADATMLTPYHPPFFASWLGLWGRTFGADGLGNGVLPWTLAYLLAAGAIGSVLGGAYTAVWTMAVLAQGPALYYYGVTPYAEMTAGALILAGLWALMRLAADRPDPVFAGLAGLLLGLAGLAKVDMIPPIGVALTWWMFRRRARGGWREGAALAAGLALPTTHALQLGTSVSALYVGLNGGGVWRLVVAAWPLALSGGVLAGLLWALWRRQWRRPRPLAVTVQRSLQIAIVVGLAALTVARLMSADTNPTMVALLSWLLTPIGVWAAVAGWAYAGEDGPPSAGPILAMAWLAIPAVLVAPVVTETYSALYTARRLVPLALPVAAALAAFAGVRWWRDPAVRWAVVAGVFVTNGVLFSTTMSIRAWRDFSGGATLATRLAAYGGAQDVLLFASTLGGDVAGRMAPAVWNLTGRAAYALGPVSPDPDALGRLLDAWRAEGRRVFYVLQPDQSPPEIPGYRAESAGEESLLSPALAPSQQLPPESKPLEISCRIYEWIPEAEPAAGG